MNYSKWDKFVAEQSDSDDEKMKPAVRVVGEKEKVKIGPTGYQIEEDKHKPVKPPGSSLKVDHKHVNLDENKLMLNGSRGDLYYWRQDRQEVIVTIILPADVRGKDVSITYNTANKLLKVCATNGLEIIGKALRYGIDTESMTSIKGDKATVTVDPADWEVKTLPFDSSSSEATLEETRVLELSLRKVSPLPGAVFWWRNCFEGEPEIDVTKISGRPSGATQQDLLKEDPFAIAQKMFLEKMKTREKVEVDLNEP